VVDGRIGPEELVALISDYLRWPLAVNKPLSNQLASAPENN
jgi:hypothetical protein